MGGITILDTVDYHDKLMNLLNDQNINIPTSFNNISKNMDIFL